MKTLSMKAAIVQGPGQTPVYADFPEPTPLPGEIRLEVLAAAVSPLVRGRASGRHYSASHQFPFVVGVDGVGRREDGQRVYFALPRPPLGSMAEIVCVPASQCVPVPNELDDATAATLANPGMSSMAAYTERAGLKPGETVLINGATGAAGRLAVQLAKYLGAKKVIALGRNPESLRSLAALGADVLIPLTDDLAALESACREHFAQGVDVVIDYLWGPSAERLLAAAAKSGRESIPLRYVQVGSASGTDITLPGAVLRSSALELMGSGIGSVPLDRLVTAVGRVLQAAVERKIRIATKAVPLSEVNRAWAQDEGTGRIVFVPRP